MGATLPYPDKPANGQAPDAAPILANLLALLAAIQSFDASQVATKTLVENAFADTVNPRLRDGAWMNPWIETGGWTSAFVTLGWTMPSGVAWYAGYRSLFTGAAYTVAISNDTYYSVTQTGIINTPQAVANGAAVPTLPANSQWLAKVISNATTITSILDLRTTSVIGRTIGIDATTTNPCPVTETDVIASSVTFAVNIDSYLDVSFGADQQCNANVSVYLNLNVDGVNIPRNVLTSNSNTAPIHATSSRRTKVLLTAGIHTIKLRESATASTSAVNYLPSWWGFVTRKTD